MPYPNEHACRLMDPSKLDILGSQNRKHDGKEYRVIFGRPKGKLTGSTEQAYRYPKNVWSEAEARSHCSSHEGTFEPATKAGEHDLVAFTMHYDARFEAEERDGQHIAKIYVIDTSTNKNKWRVTDEAMLNAVKSLIGKPLFAFPDHSGDVVIGRFINSQKPNGYAWGEAEIWDEEAWLLIKSGEWHKVSPQIRGYYYTDDEGVDVVTSFFYQHVAFVANPAFDSTKVLDADSQITLTTFEAGLSQLLSVTEQGSPDALVRGKSREGLNNMSPKTIEEYKVSMKELQGKFDTQKTEVDTQKNSIKTLKAENKTLKDEADSKSQESKDAETKAAEDKIELLEHKALVKTLEAERRAGKIGTLLNMHQKLRLFEAKDRNAEIEKLNDVPTNELDRKIIDAARFITVLPSLAKPITPYTAASDGGKTSQVEEMRASMLGYRRDEKWEKVLA